MKTRRTTLPAALIAAALLISGASYAKDPATQEASRENALRAAELARFDASVKADTTALDKLLDADLAYTHSNGDLETKARYISALTDGTRDYVAIEPAIEKLRVSGNIGLIHGRAHVTVASNGKPGTFDISYDDAWLWKDGRWQLTSWRSTKLPDKKPSAGDAILARFDAALHADVAALDRLLADDLEYCTFRGDCETKVQYLGEVKSGRLKYLSIAPTVSTVKMFTDNAVVTGLATVTAVRDGTEQTIHISWAGVLAWRDARWQLTTWTSTLLQAQAK